MSLYYLRERERKAKVVLYIYLRTSSTLRSGNRFQLSFGEVKLALALIGASVAVIALTIFDFIQKKAGIQKRGFTQIPNAGK